MTDDLTYEEVGASRAEPLPVGYQHIARRARLGAGDDVYTQVADGVMRWRIHELAGLHPVADADRAVVGANFVSRFEIRAFSRPVSWYARLGGRVTTWLQQKATDRYIAAAHILARGG